MVPAGEKAVKRVFCKGRLRRAGKAERNRPFLNIPDEPEYSGQGRRVLLFRIYHWKVMRIYMTFQTSGKSLVQCGPMRLAMTVAAFWNLAVFDMTGCAVQSTVFGLVGLQVLIFTGMT